MTKTQLLAQIKLLSALESWAFSIEKSLPDYLYDNLQAAIDVLTHELLSDDRAEKATHQRPIKTTNFQA